MRHVLKAVSYLFPYTALIVYVTFNVLYNMLLHPMLVIAKYLPAIAKEITSDTYRSGLLNVKLSLVTLLATASTLTGAKNNNC